MVIGEGFDHRQGIFAYGIGSGFEQTEDGCAFLSGSAHVVWIAWQALTIPVGRA